MTRDADLDSGTRKLVDDLLAKPQCYEREELLRRTRLLRYHDFKSEDAMNSITLVRHLKGAGYHDLAQNAADGKYDQDAEESRKWAEESAEGREMMQMVKDHPEVQQAMDKAAEALKKSGGLPRYIVSDDGPPEPGEKGQA